jgi:hypothetical protein
MAHHRRHEQKRQVDGNNECDRLDGLDGQGEHNREGCDGQRPDENAMRQWPAREDEDEG